MGNKTAWRPKGIVRARALTAEGAKRGRDSSILLWGTGGQEVNRRRDKGAQSRFLLETVVAGYLVSSRLGSTLILRLTRDPWSSGRGIFDTADNHARTRVHGGREDTTGRLNVEVVKTSFSLRYRVERGLRARLILFPPFGNTLTDPFVRIVWENHLVLE